MIKGICDKQVDEDKKLEKNGAQSKKMRVDKDDYRETSKDVQEVKVFLNNIVIMLNGENGGEG